MYLSGFLVTVTLEDGQTFVGDLLVGADGIRSKVRKNLFGETDVVYSGYTCYTGIADFIPADIETVGYRVFLGHKQYFVSSDVGGGKMQWYAFYNEAPGGKDVPNGTLIIVKKQNNNVNIQFVLGKLFMYIEYAYCWFCWCDNVIEVVKWELNIPFSEFSFP